MGLLYLESILVNNIVSPLSGVKIIVLFKAYGRWSYIEVRNPLLMTDCRCSTAHEVVFQRNLFSNTHHHAAPG